MAVQKYLTIIFLSLLACLSHTNSTNKQYINTQLVLIESFLEKNDYQPLPNKFQKILDEALKHENINAVILQAKMLLKLGQYAQSIQLLSNQKNPYAKQILIDWYFYHPLLQNIKKGISLLKKLVKQNDPVAEVYFSLLLERGQFVHQNLKKAQLLLQRAAKKKYLPALHTLGEVYLNGRLGEQNKKKAAYWFEQASFEGHALSRYNLAIMYLKGDGVKKDVGKAYIWACASTYQLAQSLCKTIQSQLNKKQRLKLDTLIENSNIQSK